MQRERIKYKAIKGEKWDFVLGYGNTYKISNFGRIRSIKTINCKYLLRYFIDKKGYFTVKLYKGSHGTNYLVHRLVAQNFVNNPNNYPEVNHIDCDKLNNKTENLEWCTRQQNMTHATKNGLVKSGEGRHTTTITESKAIEIIRANRHTGFGAGLLRKYIFPEISTALMHGLLSGRTWKYLDRTNI